VTRGGAPGTHSNRRGRAIASLAVGALLAVAAAPPARAELSATLTLTSDYVWRGVSQTDEKPALQAEVEYAHDSGFYAGLFGSNVDFDEDVDDPARVEIDMYAGWRGETEAGIGWDVSVLRYSYPDSTAKLDYNELVVSVTYGLFTFEVDYSNDVFASGEDGLYYSVGLEHELPAGFTLGAGVGYSDFDEEVFGDGAPDSYVDWRVGVSTERWGLGFDLSYYDTNGDGEELNGDWAEPRVVLSVSKTF
jgi:uncharacterized protein (TIGR02001 family)